MTLTLIIPATNHPATLPRCLAAIAAAEAAPEQIVVVEDDTLTHPALARNAGAQGATGDVLVFVDADVTVHTDAFVRIRRAFDTDPELLALFGSYDDAPDSPSVVSSFRNLLHHYVHQRAAGPASTFWAGLGAIRRDAFMACGGFIVHPVEDIELGMRLSRGGARILLDPTIQGTHLKKWSLLGMLRTDLLVRGMPWVGLLLEYRHSASTSALNLGWPHRLSALASLTIVVALAIQQIWIAIVALTLLLTLNHMFYRFLIQRQGVPCAACGVALHLLHHLVSIAAVPLGMLAHIIKQRRSTSQPRLS
ncbi:MAG: glycosyltransferase [Gemmatimonadales bacterium]|nr:glycosyltransferase [Gemmatimonadales bacterium]